MMRQSEFKMKLDPELGRCTRQHIWSGERSIYVEGIMEMFKSFGKTAPPMRAVKSAVKKGAKKVVTAAATKTGEHVGKKAGDKIVQMLSKEKVAPPAKKVTFKPVQKTMTQQEINQRVNAILSGGKII